MATVSGDAPAVIHRYSDCFRVTGDARQNEVIRASRARHSVSPVSNTHESHFPHAEDLHVPQAYEKNVMKCEQLRATIVEAETTKMK
jgi:hypothetical protein